MEVYISLLYAIKYFFITYRRHMFVLIFYNLHLGFVHIVLYTHLVSMYIHHNKQHEQFFSIHMEDSEFSNIYLQK